MSTDYDRDTLFMELPVANSTMRIRYRKTDAGSWAAVDRYNGTTGKRTIYDPYICDSANTLIAYTSTDIFYVAVPSLRFDVGVAAPTLKQEARISNAATADLTVASQAPYASASGSNRNPGNLVLSVPAAASGGTEGKVSLQVAGAEVVGLGTTGFTYAKGVASPVITHAPQTTDVATSSLTITSQGPVAGASSNRNPGNIILSVPAPAAGGTAGVISLCPSATETLQVYNNGTILNFPNNLWAKSVASPTLLHNPQTTDVATTGLTITSQGPYASATGTNRNPGNITLTVPAAAAGGSAGEVAVSLEGAKVLGVSPAALTWAKAVSAPVYSHAQQTTDAACTGLSIASQAPYASATGSNRNPGNLTLTVPAAASGGTEGKISLQVAGAAVVEADPAKIFVATTSGAPGTNPTGGVYLYLESDTLKYRDSSGVVHTVTATTP